MSDFELTGNLFLNFEVAKKTFEEFRRKIEAYRYKMSTEVNTRRSQEQIDKFKKENDELKAKLKLQTPSGKEISQEVQQKVNRNPVEIKLKPDEKYLKSQLKSIEANLKTVVDMSQMALVRQAFSTAISLLENILNGFLDRLKMTLGIVKESVNRYSTLDSAIQTVKSLNIDNGSVTPEGLEQLIETVRQTANDLPLITDEIANGIVKLTQSGLGFDTIADYVDDIAKGATATKESFDLIAGIASSASNVFTDNSLSEVLDVLSYSANNAQQTISNLGEALTSLKGTNIPLDVFSLLSMRLADVGIRGSFAGTAIRNFFNYIQKNSDKFEELGIDVFDNAGNIRSETELIKDILTLYQQLNDERKAQFGSLFGERGKAVLTALDRSTPQNIDTELANINNSSGLIDRQVDVMMSGLSGAAQRFEAAIDTLLTFDIGKSLEQPATLLITGALNTLENVRGELRVSVSEIGQEFVASMTDASGGLTNDVKMSLDIIATTILRLFETNLKAIANIITTVLNNPQSLTQFVDRFFQIRALMSSTAQQIFKFFTGIGETIDFIFDLADTLQTKFKQTFDSIGRFVVPLLEINSIVDVIDKIKVEMGTIDKILKLYLIDIGKAYGVVTELAKSVVTVIPKGLRENRDLVVDISNTFTDFLDGFGFLINLYLPDAVEWTKEMFVTFKDFVAEFIQHLRDYEVLDSLLKILDNTSELILYTFRLIAEITKTIVQRVTDFLNWLNMVNESANEGKSLAETIVSNLTMMLNRLNTIIEIITAIVKGTTAFFIELRNSNNIIDAISTAITSILSDFDGLISKSEKMGKIWQGLKETFERVDNFFRGDVDDRLKKKMGQLDSLQEASRKIESDLTQLRKIRDTSSFLTRNLVNRSIEKQEVRLAQNAEKITILKREILEIQRQEKNRSTMSDQSLSSSSSGSVTLKFSDRVVKLSEADKASLAYVILNEAGFDPREQNNVFQAIINRVLSNQFPNTVGGVIYEANQFSPIGDMGLRDGDIKTLNDALEKTRQYRPNWSEQEIVNALQDMFTETITLSRLEEARELIGGRTFFKGYNTGYSDDVTSGGNYYHIYPQSQTYQMLDELFQRNRIQSIEEEGRRVSQQLPTKIDTNSVLIEGVQLDDLLNYQSIPGNDEFAPRPGGRLHAGLDFDSSIGWREGVAIKSIIDGVVEQVYELGGAFAGQRGVRIVGFDAEGKELYTALNHLSEVMVNVGDKISAGDVVGRGTGDHLDIKTRVDNQQTLTKDFIRAVTSTGGTVGTLAGTSINIAMPESFTEGFEEISSSLSEPVETFADKITAMSNNLDEVSTIDTSSAISDELNDKFEKLFGTQKNINITETPLGLEPTVGSDIASEYSEYLKEVQISRRKLLELTSENLNSSLEQINDRLLDSQSDVSRQLLESQRDELRLRAKLAEEALKQLFYQQDVTKLQEVTGEQLSDIASKYEVLSQQIESEGREQIEEFERERAAIITSRSNDLLDSLRGQVESFTLDDKSYLTILEELRNFRQEAESIIKNLPLNELQQQRLKGYLKEAALLESIVQRNVSVEMEREAVRQRLELAQISVTQNGTIRELESKRDEMKIELYRKRGEDELANALERKNLQLNREQEFKENLLQIELERQRVREVYQSSPDLLESNLANLDLQTKLLREQYSLANQLQNEIQETDSLWQQMGDSIQTSLVDSLTSVAMGTKTALEAFRDMVNSMLEMLIRSQLQQLMLSIFGSALGSGVSSPSIQLSKPPKSFNTGGLVPGDRNSADADSVFAHLTPGEYVLPRKLVNLIGVKNLDRLREYKDKIRGFNDGGLVSSLAISSSAPVQQEQTLRHQFETISIGKEEFVSLNQLMGLEESINRRIAGARMGATKDMVNSLMYDSRLRSQLAL